MKNGTNTYSLIRLTLQKRIILHEQSPLSKGAASDKQGSEINSGKEITVLGYYDRLIFENLSNWYALRPGISNAISLPKKFSNEYTLRLVAPDWIKCECKRKVFDYSYFDTYGLKEEQQAILVGSIVRYPLFAALLINCSDGELKKVTSSPKDAADALKELFHEILDAVNESIRKLKLNSLKIGIYLSLGYSEFVLLISGCGVKDINRLIDETRLQLLVKHKCASSTYTVLGFDDTLIDSVKREKINAAIDFSMLPGKTLEESDFQKLWNKIGKSDGYIAPVMLMGAIDWRWELKDCYLAKFLHAYKGDIENDGALKSFGNDNGLFKIVHTRLQLKRPADFDEEEKLNRNESEAKSDALQKAYQRFKDLYNGLIKKCFVHRRSLYAIQGIMYLYNKVVDSSYGGDVRTLAEPFFSDFLDIMNGQMKLLLNDKKELQAEKKNFLTVVEGIDTFLQERIQKFRELFEPYLFAIYRSDHAFFEGQSLVHPSIGSAAKLLFCYNQVLYEWEEKYHEWEESEKVSDPGFDGTSTNFSYLVTSGGVDSTANWDIFDYISNFLSIPTNKRRTSRPLVVTMSEAGLYNLDGTLLKLAHEFFHKRGDRMRKHRAQAYIEDICFEVAGKIADWYANTYVPRKIYDRIENIVAFDKRKSCLSKKTAHKVVDSYNATIRKYSSHLEKFEKALRDELFLILYDNKLIEKFKQITEHRSRAWRGCNLRKSCLGFLWREWRLEDSDFWSKYTNSKENSDDTLRKKIACKIYELSNQKLMNLIAYPMKGKSQGDSEGILILRSDFEINPAYMDETLFTFDRKDEIKSALVAALKSGKKFTQGKKLDSESGNKFEAWEDLARECFADCLAIKTMIQDDNPNDPWGKEKGMRSYLRAFLFEVHDPDELLKVSRDQINGFWAYRIFILKELLGWNSESDEVNLEKEIEEWYDMCFYPQQKTSIDKSAYVNKVINAWRAIKDAWTCSSEWGGEFGCEYNGLIKYLGGCISRNESLCRLMQKVHVSALQSDRGTIEQYSQFVFEKWMEIFREKA